MKKILALLVCLMLLCATAYAAEVAPNGEYPIVSETLTFTAYMSDNTSWMHMDETNRALQKYEKDTNIHLEPVFGDIKLLLAANNYPELIFSAGFTNQEVYDYGLQGLVIPLNDLLDKYAPFLKQAQEEYYPHMWEDWTSPDGNIYGIATSGSSFGGNTQKAYVNVKWLAELGLEIPTTIEEFETVLKAFKAHDPEYYPLTGAVNTWWAEPQYFLINPFILCDQDNYFLYVQEGNKVASAAVQDEFREGLRWAKSLYDQGLLDPGAFTQELTQLQAYNADTTNPHIGVVVAGHLRMFTDVGDGTYDLDAWYDAVPPLKGPSGEGHALWNDNTRTSGASFCITDACSNPEAAMRYLNYWVTPENFFWNWMGDEGHNYVPATEGQLNWKGEQALINDVRWFPDFKYLDEGKDMEACRLVQTPATPWVYWENAQAVQGEGVAENNWWKYDVYTLGNMAMKYKPFVGEQNLPQSVASLRTNEDQGAVINQYGLALKNYINQSIAAFITGSMDIESEWDAYVAGVNGLGLDTFVTTVQGAYDELVWNK